VVNYVEPFAGSLAVLLAVERDDKRTETVNDLDCYLANFWRAAQSDPEAVADAADWPVNEADLHARHVWLVGQREDLAAHMMGDPEYYDAKIAGWWLWGICSWIAGGWCSGNGPWHSAEGRLVEAGSGGVKRKRPHLGNMGLGINRKRPHLGNMGLGINRKRPDTSRRQYIIDTMTELQERLRDVRVCCGDWSRVCGPTPTIKIGLTGVFLDPPYTDGLGDACYNVSSDTVAGEVARWALEWGRHPLMRIAYCGYEGQFDFPGWRCVPWKAHGGYGSQSTQHDNPNARRERIWFSPGCLEPERQRDLFS